MKKCLKCDQGFNTLLPGGDCPHCGYTGIFVEDRDGEDDSTVPEFIAKHYNTGPAHAYVDRDEFPRLVKCGGCGGVAMTGKTWVKSMGEHMNTLVCDCMPPGSWGLA